METASSGINGMQELKGLSVDEALRTLEQYRMLLVASETGAWEYHTDTDVLECNDIYFSLLGRQMSEYDEVDQYGIKHLWIDLLHPEDVAEATERFSNYLNNPIGIYESTFRMSHADGSWRWIASRGRFLTDESGELSNRVIGTHIDITKQKQAEEEIKRDRLLLRTLIDSMPDTIYVKDDLGRKVIANKSDVELIGAGTEADIIGKTDLEIISGEPGIEAYNDDMELIRSGVAILNKEELFYDRKGNATWLLTSKVPVKDEHGKTINIIGIGRNITHRKKTEDELNELNQQLSQQAEHLQKLNEQILEQKEQELEKAIAQGKFEIASEVLHDIGNALVGFGSHLNRIKRVIDRSSLDGIRNLSLFLKTQQETISTAIGPDKAKALVSITDGFINVQDGNQKEIITAITDVLGIISHIQEILSIQRQLVRAHEGSHERRPVNLLNIIEDSRSMLFASLEKRGVEVRAEIKPGKYVIKGDHTKLMQVILNVFKNSLEALPVEMGRNKIGIFMENTGEQIILRITDNGHGFDQETAAKLFERGFTTKVTGTGLGLYNCRSIIESHAGTFDLTSEGIDKGAVTTITFKV